MLTQKRHVISIYANHDMFSGSQFFLLPLSNAGYQNDLSRIFLQECVQFLLHLLFQIAVQGGKGLIQQDPTP